MSHILPAMDRLWILCMAMCTVSMWAKVVDVIKLPEGTVMELKLIVYRKATNMQSKAQLEAEVVPNRSTKFIQIIIQQPQMW